jgi:hypothetical protein
MGSAKKVPKKCQKSAKKVPKSAKKSAKKCQTGSAIFGTFLALFFGTCAMCHVPLQALLLL